MTLLVHEHYLRPFWGGKYRNLGTHFFFIPGGCFGFTHKCHFTAYSHDDLINVD